MVFLPRRFRAIAALFLLGASPLSGESMVQYFNTSWRELAAKMPELAEAGYESLWLPPPTKGSGGLSVGYDCWDRFDLGSKDQRGSVRTRYGTEAELLEMMRVAHRFGIRVYFDNIMNHNAFDVPGYNAFTPIDRYPGFLPEDFHLRRTEDGFYRKWDNTRDWNDAWQVQNLGLADLIDIATEPGPLNHNHGDFEGDTIPKFEFVRHPDNPGFYCYKPNGAGQSHAAGQGDYVGFGTGNGITPAFLAANQDFYQERVEDFLHRSARWKMDRTRADGLRLDAVKHTPADFFGATFGIDKDSSDYGYSGQVQRQFNFTRGFSDTNHRDTVFNTEQARDDAMLFGEHLGQPPAYSSYIDAGMRLVDNDLRGSLNGLLGNPSAGLNGFDQPGSGGFSPGVAVMHAQSHDNDFAARRELQHAFYFTREGLPLVYTDGNFHAETLGESGGAFPRHANTAFLGQWGDARLPNLATFHQHFARGYQSGRWSDGDFVAYERIDKRENGGMSDSDGVVALVMINDNYAFGASRTFGTSFPSTGGAGSEDDPDSGDAYLYQYARGYGSQTGFYTYASGLGSVIVDPGSYFLFSWKNPDPSNLWSSAGGSPITIEQGGQPVGTVTIDRRDGPDGDPGFNPYGVADTVIDDFTYSIDVPRVTDGSDLGFIARVDGSAENVLFKLDGGIDLNGAGTDPAKRDNPPAVSSDVFLGYEQPTFIDRQFGEKFAAVENHRNKLGSGGAETYAKVIDTPGFTIDEGPDMANEFSNDGSRVAEFLYHDPEAVVGGTPGGGWPGGMSPDQYVEEATIISLWAKPNSVGGGFKMFCYYTSDGSNPEGAGGMGRGTTEVVEMNYSHDEGGDNWWSTATLPKPASGATIKYKIGIYKEGVSSVFPSSENDVIRKVKMMTSFGIDGFDATAVEYFPHHDYARTPVPGSDYSTWPWATETGLDEGFHVLRARAFLDRNNKASIYNTFVQTFYYDAATPSGEIVFPANNGDIVGGSEYGVVVRADSSTSEVWYRITDGDSNNDDATTGVANGNGDWVRAGEVTTTLSITPGDPSFTREFRFNYVNIPSSGTGTIKVRLKEISSSADNGLSDAAGHFTTLSRSVNTAGPDLRMFVAFPPADGDTVDDNYDFKVYFSEALGNDLGRFFVRYGGNDGWDPGTATVLDPAELSIDPNDAPSGFDALTFVLPNLYNGLPGFLHRVEIVHDRDDPAADLTATRRVTFAPSAKPRVTIIQPQEFDSDGRAVEIVLPDGPGADSLDYTVRVETDDSAAAVALGFTLGTGTPTPVDFDPGTPGIQPEIVGSSAFWDFTWTIDAPGQYRLLASATSPTGSADDTRNARVILREQVAADPNDLDDDDDGLADVDEGTPTPLPNGFPATDPRYKPNSENWNNGEVHIHNAYGNSNPLLPDSDGDGLPDGLEVGWRTPGTDTNASTDTNGDGFPNFIGDLDPPFFNTLDNLGSVPGVNTAAEGGDRAKQLEGTTTNPSSPDTDGDGLRDGIEDANRNGWVDGDGASLAATDPPTLGRSWPNGQIDSGETWAETSPTDSDTDDDGLSDGFGEDIDLSGDITGDDGDRIWQSPEVWLETDPLKADTDGDGLPDGWERRFGLNPLDDGSMTFDGTTPNANNGASGDPDDDGLTNSQELLAGTDPRVDNSVVPQPGDAVIIGPVAEQDAIVVGAVENRREFTDWNIDDLVVLDEYEGDGGGNQGGDTYLAYDGFDSSRDMVAFYARDGGDPAVGGTGEFYFRVDFDDLRTFAEEGNLDLYVVIDTGNDAVGEYTLPDEVDTGTLMRWEAVVAVYQSNSGAVYVDTNPATNTTGINEDLTAAGVQRRDENTADGFLKSYFSNRFDAVEFSISRQALLDAGWLGDPASLNFQVISVRDGTRNSPQGAGDIGGRTDIRDTFYDDHLAEDYWRDQGYISQNSELRGWFNYNGPDRGKRTKVMMLVHETRAIGPGSEIQELISNAGSQQEIDDGDASGFYRPLDVHQAYGAMLGLHVSPTLASVIEWAAVDPGAGKEWLDGPAFNDRIGRLAAAGTVELISGSFADAPLQYFSQSWLNDNAALAQRMLTGIYGTAPSPRVFWIPERVIDEDALAKVSALGYSHVFADQFRHIIDRFGRTSALLDDGYRINRINGLDTIVINDAASEFRFRTTDDGLDINLRRLASRKARSGEQHQLLVLFSNWSDFLSEAQADGYDQNVAWLSSRPWVELVGPDQVARGDIDLSIPPDGSGDSFASLNRGNTSFGRKLGPLWLDHATQGNYDFWWFGSGQEESLRDTVFEIRPGAPIARPGGADNFFGVQSFAGGGSGIAADAWAAVAGLPDTPLGRLGRGAYHAATFLAGRHDEDSNDLSTYSTGDFIYPDGSYDNLAAFARQSQSQARFAAVYTEVAAWAAAPPATAEAVHLDVDLDGEDEFLLRNDRVFALFEALGGRCTAAWSIDATGAVRQLVGNHLAFPASETEEEGSANQHPDGSPLAHRTSAFKDWWAVGALPENQLINRVYGVAAAGSGTGWTFTSPGGAVSKTITLADAAEKLVADYTLAAGVTKLYVRFGLSPDLDDLLTGGQDGLNSGAVSGGVAVSNESPTVLSTATVGLDANVTWQDSATDDDQGSFDTITMRNQAQTVQVEVESQASSFQVSLGLSTSVLDGDSDGLPAGWEAVNGLDDGDDTGDNGADGDPDNDGINNLAEWLFGLNPQIDDRNLAPRLVIAWPTPTADPRLSFPTIPDRVYQLQVSTDLTSWSDHGAPVNTVGEGGPGTLEIDDPGLAGVRFYRVVVSAP